MDIKEVIRLHGLWAKDLEGGEKACFSSANLRGEDLRGENLRGADLSGANLRGADLSGANLRVANLRGANLRGADLSGADLSGADLRGADLSWADFRGSNLRGSSIRGVDLMWAAFTSPVFRLDTGKYSISFNAPILHIGCRSHTIEEWESFSDEDISKMDIDALEFWKEHKEFLLLMCKTISKRKI